MSHDVLGGLMEGFAADNGNSHVEVLEQVGHRGPISAIQQPSGSSSEPPVAKEKNAVLAALVQQKLGAPSRRSTPCQRRRPRRSGPRRS